MTADGDTERAARRGQPLIPRSAAASRLLQRWLRPALDRVPADLVGRTVRIDMADIDTVVPLLVDEVLRVVIDERHAAQVDFIAVPAASAMMVDVVARLRGVADRVSVDRRG